MTDEDEMEGDENILIEMGARLRNSRIKSGLSQEALASIADLDRTYIGGVERGERNVSILSLHKIATALGMSLSDVFPDD